MFQIETAMGAALGVIEGARALRVPRDRFTPVKTTNDLLALRSDAYEVADDGRVVLVAERDGSPPVVDLDPDHFKLVADFEPRVAGGRAVAARRRAPVVRGDVTLRRRRRGPRRRRDRGPRRPGPPRDGTVLEGS